MRPQQEMSWRTVKFLSDISQDIEDGDCFLNRFCEAFGLEDGGE